MRRGQGALRHSFPFRVVAIGLAAVMALGSCSVQQQRSASELPGGETAAAAPVQPGAAPSVSAYGRGAVPTAVRPQNQPIVNPKIAEIYPATGGGLGQATRPRETRATGDIQFNFEEAELRDVVTAVLRDTLGENVVVDPDVRGRVTLRSGKGLTREQALQVIETVLQSNGAVLLRQGGAYRAASAANAAGAGAPRFRLMSGEAGYGLQVHPLQYIGAEEMGKILKPLLPEGRPLIVDGTRNLIIAGGTSGEQRLIAETVQVFDVDVMAGQFVLLETLQNADVSAITFELDNIFGSKNGPLAGAVRFLPIERMNAVLVIARQGRYIDEARNWIARLDRARTASGRRLYVYYVQNGKSASLARTLRGIYGGGNVESGVTPGPGRTNPGPDGNVRNAQPGYSVTGGPAPINPAVQGPGAPPTQPIAVASAGQGGGNPALAQALAEGASGDTSPRIIADESNNALLILATARDYESIEETLAKLDIMPLQVMIETSIVEVQLNDQLQYGVQYFLGNADSRIPAALAASIIPGLGASYLFGASVDPRVLISVLSTITEVNVVSSPQVLVLDNQSARLQVGDEVPILTRFTDITGSAADPRTVNSVEYRQTGVTLEVVPRVGVNGLVNLEVGQEVSDVTQPSSASAIQSPTIRQRRILSSVAVRSGETVALGGLIREGNNVVNSGVPWLHTIPVLGALFGYRSGNAARTELLVFITPKVLRNELEARDLTQELRQRFQAVLALQEKGPPLIRTPIQP